MIYRKNGERILRMRRQSNASSCCIQMTFLFNVSFNASSIELDFLICLSLYINEHTEHSSLCISARIQSYFSKEAAIHSLSLWRIQDILRLVDIDRHLLCRHFRPFQCCFSRQTEQGADQNYLHGCLCRNHLYHR